MENWNKYRDIIKTLNKKINASTLSRMLNVSNTIINNIISDTNYSPTERKKLTIMLEIDDLTSYLNKIKKS